VDQVLEAELEHASVLIPPYFYADSPEVADLNVSLAGLTNEVARRAEKRVRPVLAAPRSLLADRDLSERLAKDYVRAGNTTIELRLSPLGGEDDGARKISSALDIVAWFALRGLNVTLGLQGHVGQTALALGLATSYSTGIGFREQFNYPRAISQQRRAAALGGPSFGASAGVFLPEAGVTIQRAIASDLYADKTIRSRLACSVGSCSRSIDGPVNDPRGHFLHARAALVEKTLGYPERWRAAQEQDRLERAIEFREVLNREYLSPEKRLKTRTVRALAGEIQRRIQQSQSA
jgi:hypothetical protein